MTDKEEVYKRTLALMKEGAREEQAKFDKHKKALKSLKTQLEVIF